MDSTSASFVRGWNDAWMTDGREEEEEEEEINAFVVLESPMWSISSKMGMRTHTSRKN